MRFDTWSLVVREILAEHFQITDERPLFCVPPSFTTVARTSLFAEPRRATGEDFKISTQVTRPPSWRQSRSQQPEAKAKLRLLKEAETLKARAKLAATDTQARLVNVLIYASRTIATNSRAIMGNSIKRSLDLIGNRAQGTAGSSTIFCAGCNRRRSGTGFRPRVH